MSDSEAFLTHEYEHSYKVIWARSKKMVMRVDHEEIQLLPNKVLSLAPNQKLDILETGGGYVFQNNREFYCIVDHDRGIF